MANKNDLSYEFACNDPIIETILEKWHFPVWLIPITMILIDIVIYFGLGSYLGYLHTNTSIKGTLDAPGELIISFLFQPIIVAYFLWFPSKLKKVFGDLCNNEVIPKNVQKSKFADFLKYFTHLYNHPLLVWFCVVFSIIIAIWITAWAILLKLGGFWVHYLIWPYVIFEIPKMFLTAYAIAYLFFHILITQFGFSELFRRIEINVQPLHHDGAGGLASIGKLIGSYFYWLIAASFFVINAGITTTSQQSDFPVYVILQFAILPIFTCLAFFGPSLSTHTAMQRSIERQLKGINEKYEILLRSVTGKKSVSSANELKNLNEFINTSIRIREISPTWPFNSQTYYRFLASLGTSLIPLMLTLVENYLFDFLPKIKP